jgi:16S rRNA processing protein RimM
MRPTEPRPERLEVGRIGRAHGLHGEISVAPITNRAERFSPGSHLYVGDTEYVIASARPHQGRFLVRFEGIDDRTAADGLRGKLLTGDPLDTVTDGELWVHELIGEDVVTDDGVALGTIMAVEANPAHDLLVLPHGRLIPIVFVVGHKDGIVTVKLPEGLLDL